MSKSTPVNLEKSRKERKPLRLSPQEMKALYLLREPLMEDIIELSMMLEETERKLALDMLIAIMSHKKRSLS
ncbi:hypothetical protein [Salinarimonas sp.]|uniref:hypothetical protein n=1 Tax=Salinarimonas sp. TaxID=2766526 RepID=UPI0032D90B42